ncbi:MAG: M23 family metallopeptidase [Treponema sp.]|nr:M23 family metallopeptidase [Treponema sp.]MCL2251646.1 M23 family metallopeptidase [Treponema sp.]
MKKRVICFVFICLFFLGFLFDSLDAMNWPSLNAVLISNFGANNNGKPILGMVFAGGEEILAAESGEVIFSRSKNDPASRLPSPLGAWTAIDHGDGLISIYSRYAESPVNAEREDFSSAEATQVEKQQPIAFSGISGWSAREGFYFMIFDRRERRWINPAMIITPAHETTPVQIFSVELRNAQGQIVQSRNLTQGRYTVYVNAAGGIRRSVVQAGIGRIRQFAPQRIVCSVNGAEVGSLNFEAVSARDGILMVSRNGLVSAGQVYRNFPSFEAAEVFLTRGQVTLEVIVQDISGDSRSVTNYFFIN